MRGAFRPGDPRDDPAALPSGWAHAELSDVQLHKNESVNPAKFPDEKYELYSVPSFETGGPEIVRGKQIGSSKQVVEPNTVLLCRINPRINRVWIVGSRSDRKKIASTEWIPFPSTDGVDPRFLAYFMRQSTFRDFLAMNASGVGGSLMRVKPSTLGTYAFPIAPIPEQQRIVAKIEELFTKLDAGVEALQKVRAQLKRYRQAVLKHAFEGKLTAAWREAHSGELEPASVLLERIREERKRKAGAKYREAPVVDASSLPPLPEAWVWATLADLGELMQYGTSEKATADPSGIPVVRMGNIRDGELVLDDLKYFPSDWPAREGFALRDGDLLFNRTNSAELVGKTAVYREGHPRAVFASYLIRVRVATNLYDPNLLSFFINSYFGRQYIASVVSQQVGQANVSGSKLAAMPVCCPLGQEQAKLLEEIEKSFSVSAVIERTADTALKQGERLRQSILKKAFEGKLVPQDSTDEPASALLERIRATRTGHGSAAPANRGRRG